MLLGSEYQRIAQASNAGDAILTTKYEIDEIFKGRAFMVQKNFTIPSSGVVNILIDYTTYAGKDKTIVVRPASYSTTSGPVTVSISRGTNYTGGTVIPVNNLNTMVGGVSKTTFTTGATGTDKGTVAQEMVVGYGSTNQSSGGGTMTSASLIVRGNTGKTLIEITNQSGTEVIFNFLQEIYEI